MAEKTNNELDTALQLISKDISDIKDSVLRVETQTMKTNGRVDSLMVWRGFVTGGLAVIVVLLLPVVFILVSSFLKK
jgi:hypothetical protein